MKTMDNFVPELRIFGKDDQLVVVFDSLAKLDVKRAVRIIQIPATYKKLSFALAGFDEASVRDDRCTISGKINLVVSTDSADQETTYELADCEFVIPASSKTKDGFQFVPVENIQSAVRLGVSDALVAAISDFYTTRSSGSVAEHQGIAVPYIGTRIEGSLRRAATNDEPKTFRRKMVLAIVGTPLLIWFLAWGSSKLFTSPGVESAVSRAMTQDPASVEAQVELTKQTLEQMGLDPGKSADIGCLAPQ